jgi:hypothetical protein
MLSGEKKQEFRKPSEWIKTRLIGKDYDLLKFVNGYGSDKPYFVCEYLGYELSAGYKKIAFQSSEVEIEKGDLIIHLGKIIETGNLQ